MATRRSEAIATARAFAAERYPAAELVFLGGSWASGLAHGESDVDVVVIDDTAEAVSFEGTMFRGSVIEACVLPAKLAEAFFHGSAEHRAAPVPPQVADGLLVFGDECSAATIRQFAKDALAAGPRPISEEERSELRYELSSLLIDLKHVGPETLTAISAVAHVQLSKAVIDLRRAWRADRKSLRRAVARLDSEFANELDAALIGACAGDRGHMVKLCEHVLDSLDGPNRTYSKFSVGSSLRP